jgi:flagellar biosynthesis protein FlhA
VQAAVATRKNDLTSGLVVPAGIVSIVLMMVLPVPPMFLDALMATSLTIAFGVFLIALFVQEPLEYSVFPAVVLVATLLRLSINVATTRQILLHGAESHAAAGRIVETFGRVAIGGNVFVGLVVFLILVVINFVVITKGAGRVAEVAARFTLDAMPGKQMSIDADLNAGLVTPDEAKRRRQAIAREADFFGAMDGASKFVHGDAIAGLLITGINLLGGLVVGVMSGLDLSKAVETFSILTIGDALAAQIPALLISTASGIVVTRSATGEELGAALTSQLLGSRRAVALTAGGLALFGLLPGMPALPFLTLAGGLGYVAWKGSRQAQQEAQPKTDVAKAAPGSKEDIESALGVEVLTLEVGYGLVSIVDPSLGSHVVDRIGVLRRQFAEELGFVVPPVRLRDNLSLPPETYRFLLLGTEVAKAAIPQGRLLALRASETAPDIEGEPTRDPAFGTPAYWIRPRDRELAEALGYTVVDAPTVLVTHLGEVVRKFAADLLGRPQLDHIFEVFSRTTPKMVDELVPNLLSMSEVLKVFRNLLREGISIRDLRTVLESLLELAPSTKDPEQLTEMTRQRLARQITANHMGSDGAVSAIVLDPTVEEMLLRTLRDIASGAGGALDPSQARLLSQRLDKAIESVRNQGLRPVLVTRADLRRFVRTFAEQRATAITVLSYREIEPNVPIRPIATVSLA